jgi:hypothetical protein
MNCFLPRSPYTVWCSTSRSCEVLACSQDTAHMALLLLVEEAIRCSIIMEALRSLGMECSEHKAH